MTTAMAWVRDAAGKQGDSANPFYAIDPDGRRGWHCEKVSAGCKMCYSERLNETMRCNHGTGRRYGHGNLDGLRLELDEAMVERWTTARVPRPVFVCSMTDWAGEWWPDEFRYKMFRGMAVSPHRFYLLTKRPVEAQKFVRTWAYEYCGMPRNVWLGVSVEDEATASERIPILLQTPAAHRFVSYEPALGPVDFRQWIGYIANPERSQQDETHGRTDCLSGRDEPGTGDRHSGTHLAYSEARVGSVESAGASEQMRTSSSGNPVTDGVLAGASNVRQDSQLYSSFQTCVHALQRSDSKRHDGQPQERQEVRQSPGESGIDDVQRTGASCPACPESGQIGPERGKERNGEAHRGTGEGNKGTAHEWRTASSNSERVRRHVPDGIADRQTGELGALFWVICGCESGPKRRPCSIEWVRDTVKACRDRAISVFVKQLDIGGKIVHDVDQFPTDLRVREIPNER